MFGFAASNGGSGALSTVQNIQSAALVGFGVWAAANRTSARAPIASWMCARYATPGLPLVELRVSELYMPVSSPLSPSVRPVPVSMVWICHTSLTFCANLSELVSRSK